MAFALPKSACPSSEIYGDLIGNVLAGAATLGLNIDQDSDIDILSVSPFLNWLAISRANGAGSADITETPAGCRRG